MITPKKWIENHHMTMRSSEISRRDGWDIPAKHWHVVLTVEGRSWSGVYSAGIGHMPPISVAARDRRLVDPAIRAYWKEPHSREYGDAPAVGLAVRRAWRQWKPDPMDVLTAVVSDARSVAYSDDVGDWVDEGLVDIRSGNDLRKALHMWDACGDAHRWLASVDPGQWEEIEEDY